MKTKTLFLIAFLIFVVYSVYAWFFNQEQEKKNLEVLEQIKKARANEPQQYDASGNPITTPLLGYNNQNDGKILDPITSISEFVGYIGFIAG